MKKRYTKRRRTYRKKRSYKKKKRMGKSYKYAGTYSQKVSAQFDVVTGAGDRTTIFWNVFGSDPAPAGYTLDINPSLPTFTEITRLNAVFRQWKPTYAKMTYMPFKFISTADGNENLCDLHNATDFEVIAANVPNETLFKYQDYTTKRADYQFVKKFNIAKYFRKRRLEDWRYSGDFYNELFNHTTIYTNGIAANRLIGSLKVEYWITYRGQKP